MIVNGGWQKNNTYTTRSNIISNQLHSVHLSIKFNDIIQIQTTGIHSNYATDDIQTNDITSSQKRIGTTSLFTLPIYSLILTGFTCSIYQQ
ncbi:hypothetical protein DERF_004927 [Dermatophagoides farinae]|uniref:Uncharacterized protein n=1 Tax=Dermatophagoides farinae TaxID=6954 RepID=A0A922I2Y4_DERFA|nr:hypothetical protein DERF_004927 [Dermatophagoides farinae]